MKPIKLTPGRVYRTRELAPDSSNPTMVAQRLVREGKLTNLSHGLFYAPKQNRFGPVPPSDQELIRAFLGDAPFVFTGPQYWNTLGLGSTALFAAKLVYNTKRTGEFQFGGRRFVLRRLPFPKKPDPEWYAVDLLEHADMAGVAQHELEHGIVRAVSEKRLSPKLLQDYAASYGTRATQAVIKRAVLAAQH